MPTKTCPSCDKKFMAANRLQQCCSRKCALNARPHISSRKQRVVVQCDYAVSEKCKLSWEMSVFALNKTRGNNNGDVICLYCSRAVKSSGRQNPNTKYKMINDYIFEHIDNEKTAYLLGWVASDGSLTDRGFTIAIHENDKHILEDLRLLIDENLPIMSKGDSLLSLSINSQQIAKDACRWLGIEPGRKSHTIQFPELDTDELKWAFLRGFFDGDGSVIDVEGQKSYPICNLTSSSSEFLAAVQKFCGIPCSSSGIRLEWSGNNALDFLAKLYENAEIALERKREQFWFWSTWVPGLSGGGNSGKECTFHWMRTRTDAVAPSKTRASDSGYDLTILEPVKTFGNVTLYTTGIKVRPSYGWYIDVVPRSSISKTGYMLANSVGVIDRTYTGEILIALIKINPDAPDIQTPMKIAQMIPRPIVHVEFVEVNSLEDTERGSGGFGSTDNATRNESQQSGGFGHTGV